MKLKIQSIMMGCMLLLLGTVALPASASAGDKLTTLMNKYGKFLMKKTGCTTHPVKEDSRQWMEKITSFRYDPKEQTMIFESLHNTTLYKFSVPLSDIRIPKIQSKGFRGCYDMYYNSIDGIAFSAKASEFDDMFFGTAGAEIGIGNFYSRRDAQAATDALRRAIKMIK